MTTTRALGRARTGRQPDRRAGAVPDGAAVRDDPLRAARDRGRRPGAAEGMEQRTLRLPRLPARRGAFPSALRPDVVALAHTGVSYLTGRARAGAPRPPPMGWPVPAPSPPRARSSRPFTIWVSAGWAWGRRIPTPSALRGARTGRRPVVSSGTIASTTWPTSTRRRRRAPTHSGALPIPRRGRRPHQWNGAAHGGHRRAPRA